jgi:hypothetical protein
VLDEVLGPVEGSGRAPSPSIGEEGRAMPNPTISRMPEDTPLAFTSVDLARTRQLRPFKIDYSHVRNLELVDLEERPPQAFTEYLHLAPPARFHTEEQPRPTFSKDLRYLRSYSRVQFPQGKVLVLVNAGLYPSIRKAVARYIRDLAKEGYFAVAYTVAGGTPADLRSFIAGKHPVGVLLVGSLPTAWFEMDDDFNDVHSEFPCDLYYMDLNGTWSDPDSDGKFSGHPTNVKPEIWVGRLWSPTAGGNDAKLIRNYFRRNHLFRKGRLGVSNRALAYVDDDWTGFGDCAFDYMLAPANIETITNPATTDADRYKAEINQYRAWAQVCAHSSPGGHSFKIPGGGEWVPNTYLRDVNPPNAFFYNLFACSNARFTQADYMAGWYVFDKSGGTPCNGLAAVGSTKTGSMLLFENFYGPMGAGACIGDAFVSWWNSLGTSHDLGERRWYYGMTLLGDPTLNWWTGAVPTLRSPYNRETFDHFPRLTHFDWDPVPVAGATYTIEIDAFGARRAGMWAAEAGTTWLVSGALSVPHYEHVFVGAQRGRWRVRANLGGVSSPWSSWRYFRYTV